MKLYTMTTYYVANVPPGILADTLNDANVDATLTPCMGTSAAWGRESTTAILSVSECSGYVRGVVARILTDHGEASALVIHSNGFVHLLLADGTLSDL